MTEHYKYAIHGKLSDPFMDIVNVYYVSFTNPFIPTASQASEYIHDLYLPILEDLPTTFGINYLGVSHWEGPGDGIWYDEATKKPLPNPPWGVELGLELTALDGVGVGDVLPPQVAALVYSKTSTKHVIARKFIGPLIEGCQNKGMLEDDAFANLVAFSLAWSVAFQGHGGPAGSPEVWGYRRGFNTLRTFVADQVLATNRRRKIGRGS